MAQQALAEAFSTGDFEQTFPFLAEEVVWTVIGENRFSGKAAVVENCRQTAAYFASVTTRFTITGLVAADNRVAVTGTAEFIRDNRRVAFVEACDVFTFSAANRILRIDSYCIPEKNPAE